MDSQYYYWEQRYIATDILLRDLHIWDIKENNFYPSWVAVQEIEGILVSMMYTIVLW